MKGSMIMYLYTAIAAIIGLIAGILLAACTKKAEGVVYEKLDKAGRITNIVLIPVYVVLALVYIGISIFASPAHDGFLGVLSWLVCAIIAVAPAACGLGLGLSVSARKKGRSKLSFTVQFAGVAACALGIGMFLLFYGNLLDSLN